ncbi:hypothetical protein HMPREF9005_1031 [Actinomyces sp. oral taxon 178 str. F0338]|nr:hypothetical protein HMPREF9005_1031 [Actinomyces sp. oral taxon 178 str. F0338]
MRRRLRLLWPGRRWGTARRGPVRRGWSACVCVVLVFVYK